MAQQEPDRAEGRLRARGRVRHVEMDTKIRNVWSEIPVPVDSGDTRFTLLVNSPQFPLPLGQEALYPAFPGSALYPARRSVQGKGCSAP